jgi:hypothetical protein
LALVVKEWLEAMAMLVKVAVWVAVKVAVWAAVKVVAWAAVKVVAWAAVKVVVLIQREVFSGKNCFFYIWRKSRCFT